MERVPCCGRSIEIVANKLFGHAAQCPDRCAHCRKHVPTEGHACSCPTHPDNIKDEDA